MHDNICGNVSGCSGNVSSICGYVLGYAGNLDDYELTPEDRESGVDIVDLLE